MLSLLSFCALGGVKAQTENTATSNLLSSTSTDPQIVEVGKPITYQCSSKNNYSNPARIYKNTSFTVSSTDDNVVITKIILTGTDKNNPVSNLTTQIGSYLNGTWTGEAASVVFTATAGQSRISTITVYYISSESNKPSFVFEKDIYPAIELKNGQAQIQVKAISADSDGKISYSVKGEPVGASITNEGLFTATAVGEYIVVAHLEAAGDYTAVTIEKTITVVAEPVIGAGFMFVETFDNSSFATEGFQTSANTALTSAGIDKFADNSGWNLTNGYEAYQAIKLGTGSIRGSATTPELDFTGDAVLTFTAAAWDGKSENTTLNLQISDGALSQSSVMLEKGKYTTYTVNITGVTKPVKITFEASEAKNNRFFLDYVSVVQESSAETLRSGLSEGKVGTICLNRTIEAADIEGAKFYTVAGACWNGNVPSALVLEETETLEAGYGYIFIAEAEAITTVVGGEATAEVGRNDGVIYGSLEGCDVPEGKYVINENQVKCSNGRSHIGAGRAYIDVQAAGKLSAEQAASPRYRVLGFDGTVTGIAAVGTGVATETIFDLAGRRVRTATKGIYVVNGKKVLVK